MTRNGALLLIENLCGSGSYAEIGEYGFPFVLLMNASDDEAFYEGGDTIATGSNIELALKVNGSLTSIGARSKLTDASITFFARFGVAPKVCVFEESVYSSMKEASDMLKNMNCRIIVVPGSGINALPNRIEDCVLLSYSKRLQEDCIENILHFSH